MKLASIYEKDINRRINPVAVVSELNDALIQQEIEEYVFTPDIYRYQYLVLDSVLNSKGERTGVWINGYYGSGKSHFLKFLYYSFCKTHQKIAIDHFKNSLRNEKKDLTLELAEKEITDARVNETGKKLEATSFEAIMFNIDTVSGDINHREAITKIFLNQLNLHQGYNASYISLAKLERQLDKAGKFADFKKEIKSKLKEDWDQKSADLAEAVLSDVLEIAKAFINIDESSFRASIEKALSGKEELSVVELVQNIQEFLSRKSENHRLVFLVDEVSQYIGENMNLLLNLQSIVEEIGSKCKAKVWVICTAQQEIKDVIGNTGQSHTDFGKIMARFEVKIPLKSNEYNDIIKKRILEKKADGVKELGSLFDKKKNIIENQFVELNNLFPTYKDKNDFIDTYPFVPYQFRLINYVFDSFSAQGFVTQGVKNTERSLLGITHYTAKNTQEESTGFIIPFDAFFNSQLTENLTILATKKLDMAYRAVSKLSDKFSERVINALFMIANLSEQYQKVFPATLDNLVYVLMNSIDQDKVALQKKVMDVLDLLQANAVIAKTELNTYRFLGDDEIIVLSEINHTKISQDAVLDTFYKEVLEKIIGDINKKVTFDGNNYEAQFRIDDKDITNKGDFKILFMVTDTTIDISQMVLQASSQDLIIAFNQFYPQLRTDFEEYVRINTYIRNNSDTSNRQRVQTLNQFKQQSKSKLDEVITRSEQFFLQTSFISNSKIVSPHQIQGNTAKAKFAAALESHLTQVYRKKSLANSYAQNEETFRANTKSTQLKTDETLDAAEREVTQVLDMLSVGVVVSDLIDKFKRPPYGWKDTATLDVLFQLARKSKRKFQFLNEPLDLKEFAEKALNNRERQKIEILAEDIIDNTKLYEVVLTVNRIFNESVLEARETDANVLFRKLIGFLKLKTDEAEALLNNHAGYPFSIHLRNYHARLKQLADRRDKKQLFEDLLSKSSDLQPVSDHFKVTREFIEDQFGEYKKIKSFTDENAGNFSSLEETAEQKGQRLISYFHSDEKPQDAFREVKGIHKELSKAIHDLIKKLKEDALEKYNQVFDSLELKVKELGLEGNYLPDRDYRLNKIKALNSIPELKLEISNGGAFETEIISKLYDLKADQDKAKGKSSKSITFVSMVNDGGGVNFIEIKNEEELEKFIEDFRKRVQAELKKNKIVGIRK
ncbi:MAG: BREX system P-loop protein BrxC [Cyclobacteriaceae bacterium]